MRPRPLPPIYLSSHGVSTIAKEEQTYIHRYILHVNEWYTIYHRSQAAMDTEQHNCSNIDIWSTSVRLLSRSQLLEQTPVRCWQDQHLGNIGNTCHAANPPNNVGCGGQWGEFPWRDGVPAAVLLCCIHLVPCLLREEVG